jgi:hypothetical protein
MDINRLAQELVAFLAPFLPYLTRLGTKAAEEAGKHLGEEAWTTARHVWDALWPTVETKPGPREAVADAAADPDDSDAQAALRHQLKKLLTEEPALAAALSAVMQPTQAQGITISQTAGSHSIQVGQSGRDVTIHRK